MTSLEVSEAHAGLRLDQFLGEAIPGETRSQLKRRIDAGEVTLNGKACRGSTRVKLGDKVSYQPAAAEPSALLPEAIPLVVLFEDAHLIVVDKPAGMVVHPAAGHASGTLVNALLHHCEDLAGIGGELRPGIVHRLDRHTSGVMVAAKDESTHQDLVALFSARALERQYVAIVAPPPGWDDITYRTLHGRHPRDRKRFTSRVRSGKEAVTHVKLVERFGGRGALVACRLETGRTHQIRVHLAEHGHPVVGDAVYGRAPRDEKVRKVAHALGRQALHAQSLGFVHPRTGQSLSFEAPPPGDMQRAIDAMRTLARS